MLFELTNPEIAILMMSLFLFAVLLGFPIAFTLLAMGVGFGYYAYFDPSRMDHLLDNRIFSLLVQNTYTIMDNTVLTAVPLFLFMGYLVERAGIVAKLFFAIRLASHRLPASMAVAALVIGAVVTLMGLLAWPAMIRAGYDKKFASGVICSGGCLGILIPPSIMLIVYAVIAQLSPLRLFAAAIFPGLMLAGLYILYVIIRAYFNPSLAPRPAAEEIPPRAEILKEVLVSFVPLFSLIILGSLPLIIIGYIFFTTGLIDYFRNLKIIAWTTLIFGLLLFFADRSQVKQKLDSNLNYKSIIIF